MLAGAAYVVADDPSDGGALVPFPPCPFETLTGLWCPGCGLTRATHHLLRGDLATALRYNLFVVVIIATLIAVVLAWLLGAAGRPVRWADRIGARAQIAAGAVLVGFGVVRNLPGIDGLRG
jgi:hypothetical protein